MTWTRLDDAVYDHPKLAEVDDPAARLLWVWSLCWANRFGTNGFLPTKSMRNLGRTAGVADLDEAAEELTSARLWIATEGGWQIHDFLVYNPSAEAVADLAAKRSAAGQKGGRRSGETRSKSEASASTQREALAGRLPKQNRSPSRPVPSPVTDVSSSSGPVHQQPSTGRDEDDLIDLTQELEAAWTDPPPVENSPTDDDASARAWEAAIEGGEADLRRAIAAGREIGAPARYALACAKDRWAAAGPRITATARAHPKLAGMALLAAADAEAAMALHPASVSGGGGAPPRLRPVPIPCPTCQLPMPGGHGTTRDCPFADEPLTDEERQQILDELRDRGDP